ncbi:MAG: hypothetical protein JJE48_06720 [Actinobacteria bacterium]|nr:hypothetical protein [Actinomycetota bacterium]
MRMFRWKGRGPSKYHKRVKCPYCGNPFYAPKHAMQHGKFVATERKTARCPECKGEFFFVDG